MADTAESNKKENNMKCALCNSKKFQELYHGKGWKIVKCLKCSLVATEREKEEMDYDFYHRDDDYKKLEDHFRNIFQKRINIVKRLTKKKGAVLEIGCSNGTMLDLFKKDGWETWGVEPSENAEYAIDKEHKVFQSTFEKVNLNTDYYDLVILNHTLEHMDNPVLVLTKIYSLLKQGGIVLVDVPNFDSLLSNMLGKNWPYLLPREHNFEFTRESLKKIFEKSGFEVVHFESRSGMFEFGNPIEELKKSLLGVKKRFVFTLLDLPYSIVATSLNKGDSMTMVGIKY